MFSLPVSHLHLLFGKMFIQFFCPLLKSGYLFSLMLNCMSFCIYWILIPYQSHHPQIFSPLSSLSFCFVGVFLCCELGCIFTCLNWIPLSSRYIFFLNRSFTIEWIIKTQSICLLHCIWRHVEGGLLNTICTSSIKLSLLNYIKYID